MSDNKTVNKSERLCAVKGMNDILPDVSWRWERLEETVRRVMRGYGYENIRTPIVEPTALFVRSIGEVTDIVEKEMYSFEDRLNGEALTLRPENTAGVVRAVVEHSLTYGGGRRLYYMGPMFRHERPQRGRYRQFHQIGAEAFGFAGPELDAELILMAHGLWKALGLQDVALQLNSLGQPAERAQHRAALIAYFEQNLDLLDEESRQRLYKNPLRLLDSKNPAMQPLMESAPRLMDYLGEASLAHMEKVQSILRSNGVSFSINPRLVRGLDYYNLTVFEFVTTRLGAQGTVCAGGRYDSLTEQIGGKPTPAVGWAMGVERVLELLRESSAAQQAQAMDVYAIVADAADYARAMPALEAVRAAGWTVLMHASGDGGSSSLKSQFKRADASGARYALVFGADELARGEVTVKHLRDGQGVQQSVALQSLASWFQQQRLN
ncbi:MAG: histidine--tRNA ligase [Rhodoferax sp.]